MRLFDKIEEDVKIFDRKCYSCKGEREVYLENTATGMAAVEWAIRKGLTQQGFTALEETIKTYLCEAYEIPAEEELTRDSIVGSTVKFLANRYNDAKKSAKDKQVLSGDEWIMLNIDKLKKVEERNFMQIMDFKNCQNQRENFICKKWMK